jgi:hypothetical protein
VLNLLKRISLEFHIAAIDARFDSYGLIVDTGQVYANVPSAKASVSPMPKSTASIADK